MATREIPFLVQLIRMSVKIVVGVVLIFGLLVYLPQFLSTGDKDEVNEASQKYGFIHGESTSQNNLLKLDINGVILGTAPDSFSDPFGFFSTAGFTFGYELKKSLLEAAKDPSVKGIFLHVSTPGGIISGSMAIFDGIKAYQKETGKPVIAYIEGLSASGGVMAMVAADAIYADKGSSIGSIGVIGEEIYFYDKPQALHGGLSGSGVTTMNGIEQTVISAGRSKDLGNPFRRVTNEERAVLQHSVDVLYDDFVKHVAVARNMDENVIVNDMGAQIFVNNEAQKFGLIDGTKSWDESISALAEQAGVTDDFRLVRLKTVRDLGFWGLFTSMGFPDINLTKQQSESEQKEALASVKTSLCAAARSQALVYYGHPSRLCP